MDQIVRTLLAQNNTQLVLTSLKSCKTSIIKQIIMFFSLMAVNVLWIYLTHKQLLFFIDLCDVNKECEVIMI